MDDRGQFVVKRNNYGYTLLEMLIALSLFLTFAALTPLMFSVIFSTNLMPIHQQEISLFFEQADKEIQGSLDAEFRSDKLYLIQPNGKELTYEQNNRRIIRKVNGTGFEIILQNIDEFNIIQSNHTVELILLSNDKEFTHKAILIQPFVNQWREM